MRVVLPQDRRLYIHFQEESGAVSRLRPQLKCGMMDLGSISCYIGPRKHCGHKSRDDIPSRDDDNQVLQKGGKPFPVGVVLQYACVISSLCMIG